MRNATLEKIVWVLIYGGLLGVSLGAFASRRNGAWGSVLMAGGATVAAVGVLLIWVRSRRKADTPR